MTQDGKPLIRNEPPSTPQLCMEVVQDYASNKISKVMAIKSIFATFFKSAEYDHTPLDKIDTAIATYKAMLNQHDNTVCMQQSVVKYWEVSGSGKFPKRMTVINSRKGHILHPPDLRDPPKNVPPMNLYSPGLLAM